MVGYEDRIAELANYVQNFQMKNYEEACTIKMIDEEFVCQGELESKRQSLAVDDTKSKKSSNQRKMLKPKKAS